MINTLDLFRNEDNLLEYKKGDVIFREGDVAESMYIIKEGKVEIRAAGKSIITADTGEIFGEMALIDESPRSAMARAASDCILIPIDQRRFNFMVQQTPFFSLYVMRILVERIRKLNERMSC
jgi:CRP/FNR family transcriptional regulator, cyclic AMP receptor protein